MLIPMDPQNSQNPVQGAPLPSYPAPGVPNTPSPDNPYKFILDTNHQPKKGLGKGVSSGLKTKIFAILGIGIALVVIIIVANALFFKKEDNATKLSALAAEQTEIIRVADLGLKTSTDGDTRNFGQTARLTVQSHYNSLSSYLKTKNVSLTPLILKSKLDSKTDAALTTAAAANKFDEVFKDKLKTSLTTYAGNIKESYKTASNETSKKLLSDMYDSVETLLK